MRRLVTILATVFVVGIGLLVALAVLNDWLELFDAIGVWTIPLVLVLPALIGLHALFSSPRPR